MKLVNLQLSQWRQFRQPFAINDLQDGINLFVGPNAAGKSTLVGAIQAAFFERHKSSSVSHLQPWGDSSAEPTVKLSFQWNKKTWKLEKRFLGHQRCDLEVDGEHFSGDEAEDKLAELMGYSFAGRGASKPEHHGIPGLLWVQQGSIQEIQHPVEYAGQYLQSALGEELGAVASGSGDWLLAKVTALRGELLTKTGRTTNDYKKIEADLDAASTDLDALDAQVETYENKVDELGRLQAQQKRDDAAKPWLAYRKKVEDAKAKLADIRKLLDAQAQAEGDIKECRSRQELVRDKLKSFQKAAKQLEKRAADKTRAQAEFDDLQARESNIGDRQTKAQQAWDSAEITFKQAREQAHRQRLETQHGQLAETVQAGNKTQDQLKQLRQQLRDLREKRQNSAIDEDALKKLKTVRQALDKLALRREVAGTRLRWELEPDKALTLDGETVSGTGERLLLETTELAIPNIGTLQLTPGGKDLTSLAREQLQREDERDNLLAELAIENLAEGEQRAATCARLDTDIQRLEGREGDLAPAGMDKLAEQLRLAEKQLATLTDQIKALPAPQPDALNETEAEQVREHAQTRLKAADKASRDYKQALMLARQSLDNAEAEWKQLHAEYDDPQRKQEEKEASRNLTDLVARQTALEDDLAQRQLAIDAAQPAALEDDIKRFENSADALENAARERQRAIERLQTELETLGAQGLEDKRNELEQTVAHLERRHAELSRRAAALDLLLERLQSKRQALTLKLQAPLQKHLDHYLKLLFPDATIRVDENLVPTVLVQNGQYGDMRDLSYGTREQMGLISRLAYADLLREAGQPTLLILDDALVHSDAMRLAHMKRVLYDAAKRHQVLLFTCHPDNWNDLGVAARDLDALKVAAT